MSGFLKNEFTKPGKTVHIIADRNPYHKIIFGPLVASWERLARQSNVFAAVFGDSYDVGRALAELNEVPAHAVYEIDHTAFDAHQGPQILRILIEEIFARSTEDILWKDYVLKAYLEPRWTFRNGCRYTTKGGRCSGDVDTTFGNTVLSEALVRTVARLSGVSTRQLCKGDDNVIVQTTSGTYDIRIFKQLGFDVKCIERTSVCQAEFCSGFLLPCTVNGQRAYKHVRVPWKVIRHTPWALGPLGLAKRRNRFREKVYMEVLANNCVPIIGALCRRWARLAGVPNVDRIWNGEDRHRIKYHSHHSGQFPIVTFDARTMFAARFGISIRDQIAAEQHLDNLDAYSPIYHPLLIQLATV